MANIKSTLKGIRARVHNDLTARMESTERCRTAEHKAIRADITRVENHVQRLAAKLEQPETPVFSQISRVYDALGDELSRELFHVRLECSLRHEKEHIYSWYLHADEKDIFNYDERLAVLRRLFNKGNKEKLIIGVHVEYSLLLDVCLLFGREVSALCLLKPTSYDWAKFGIPVVTEEELAADYNGEIIFVDFELQSAEAKARLVSKGLPTENIFPRTREKEMNTPYFSADFLIPGDHEVLIDGGAFDMTNTFDFIDWCGGRFDAVYAFEPDEGSAKVCRQAIAERGEEGGRIHLVEACTWSSDTTLRFSNDGGVGAKVDRGGTVIAARSIDSILSGARVTFIKLDVEGAELETLKGAANTIRRYRPRMAICIYHKDEDVLSLPLYIQRLVPDYKFYIRHFSSYYWYDTVLFCV